MLVRRLTLKNFRSYNDGEETAVDLPDGVVLFEGDIGSGKSTILLSIEFALFGLGAGGVFSYVIAAKPANIYSKLGACGLANAVVVTGSRPH